MVDIPGNETTTTTITIGGTITDALETVGDRDWIKLNLFSGQSVTVAIQGLSLEDSYLRIYSLNGTLLYENDDISLGVIRDSMTSFTASYTGTYYIEVGSFEDSYAGTYELSVVEYTPPPVGTIDQMANQLTSGYWGGDTHHFNVTQGGSLTVNLTALTTEGKNYARAALALWTDVIGVNFVEVNSGGQIVFDDNEEGAFSEGVWSGGIISSAIVNVSTDWLDSYRENGINNYAMQTYVHEIGHALGLGHAGNYNGDARFPFDATYQNDAWPLSVMSYFAQDENNYYVDRNFSFAYVLTPMLADIVAMSSLYGLSTTTRTGNTTYGFNSNAGRAVFDATQYTTAAYTIVDSGGIDTLDYSGFTQAQHIDLNQDSYSNVGGLVGNVSIGRGTVIENAIGGLGADEIIGNSSNNELSGRNGNDELYGNGGNDILTGGSGSDFLSGGAGNDQYRDTRSGLNGDTIGEFQPGDVLIFTDATLGSFTFSLVGGTLTYSGGSLTLQGTIQGPLVATSAAGGGVQLAISAGPTEGDDTLTGTDQADVINALGGNDVIAGLGGNDYLDGGTGADQMSGGLGNDIFIVDNAGDVVSEGAGQGTDEVRSSVAYTLGANLENLLLTGAANIDGTGNGLANTITGNSGNNALSGLGGNDILKGNAGNDTLTGGAGLDKMYGGTGDDTYVVSDTTDYVFENAGEGTDTVLSSISLTLRPNVENLTLTGVANVFGRGNELGNVITGNNGANKLFGMDGNDVLTGGGGNDRLDGGAGADQLVGGTGNDLYYINDALDTVTELVGQGTDRVYAGISYVLDANIEYLTLTGSANLDATGNNLANFIYGNSGQNILFGLNGDDRIWGWAGNDVLDGGAGTDRMWGGQGDDTYYVHSSTDYTYEYAGEGTDTVYSDVSLILRANVENLILTGSADNYGRGNGEANAITGNSGANKLFGLNGDDLLDGGAGDDLIEGGAGRDVTSGGSGADLFVFGNGDFAGMGEGSADRILDFSQAEGDRLRVSAVDANTNLGGDQAFAFIGADAFHGIAGELRYEAINGNTYVMGDTDGDGNADFWIRLDGLHALNQGDFIL